MAEYTVTFARSARKELEALTSPTIARVLPKVEALAQQPRPHRSHKLRGEKRLWRIRIGDYRVIYAIYDDEKRVDVVALRHRREAYE